MAANSQQVREMKPIPIARKAEKRQVKLKLGIQGPSGSGKTKGALALATNLWPEAKILLVDTENESASLYGDEYQFDTIPLDPPYESVRYKACIDYAVQSGYDVLILDTVSHQWDGDGGVLRRKEELDKRPQSNSFANWASFTPEHTHFIESIKQAPIHIIVTMRSKQEYALETGEKGKSKVVKLGFAPIQREGFDYEFTLIFDVQMDHKAVPIKNRTSLFEGKVVDLLDPKVGKAIKTWLEAGKPADAPVTDAAPPKPQPQPVRAATPVAPAKVDGWELDGNHLSCYVYATEKRKSKEGRFYLIVKHNGKVNGKDILFCWHESLWEALLTTPTKRCVLYVAPADFTTIEDVVSIEAQAYLDGQPYTPTPVPELEANIHGVVVNDDDIPF